MFMESLKQEQELQGMINRVLAKLAKWFAMNMVASMTTNLVLMGFSCFIQQLVHLHCAIRC